MIFLKVISSPVGCYVMVAAVLCILLLTVATVTTEKTCAICIASYKQTPRHEITQYCVDIGVPKYSIGVGGGMCSNCPFSVFLL